MSSETRERDEIHFLVILLAGVTFFLLSIHWYYYQLESSIQSRIVNNLIINFFAKFNNLTIYFLRVLYVFLIGSYFYIKVANIRIKNEQFFLIRTVYFFTIGVFLLGTINIYFYDIFIYPIFSLLVIYVSTLFFATFRKKLEDENIFGISNEDTFKRLSYKFETVDNETLKVHSAEQHMGVVGGTGAGKSDSVLKPTIEQHVNYQLPALIYDAKPELPLTKTVYTCFSKFIEQGNEIKVPLKIFNISNHKQSFRINPLDKNYITINDSTKVTELVTSFITNLNPEWRGENSKRDHWFISARTVWVSLITRFIVDDKIRSKLSLPVLWELIMTDKIGAVFEFIKEKPESYKKFSPVLVSAQGNMKQFTGEFTSSMSGLSSLIGDKYLYWLLSADEINLDINSEENKTFLSIGGNNGTPETHTPIIATIISLIMSYFREPDKLPILFQLDELYTIYLEHLAKDANLFRSNGICMQIGVQLKTMMDDMFGKNKANNIMGACGNQFYGMGNDVGTAEFLEKMLSDVEKVNYNYTDSDSGSSKGQSLKNKKAKNIREINAQLAGEFTGKIANGIPPYFSTRLKRYKYHKEELDLPDFALEAFGGEEEMEKEIQDNYNSICKFALDILESYPNNLESNN